MGNFRISWRYRLRLPSGAMLRTADAIVGSIRGLRHRARNWRAMKAWSEVTGMRGRSSVPARTPLWRRLSGPLHQGDAFLRLDAFPIQDWISPAKITNQLMYGHITFQGCDQRGHVRRRRRFEAQLLASSGVGEPEPRGMQRLPRKVEQGTPDRLGEPFGNRWNAPQIQRIADDRVANRGEGGTDLVGPPGGEPTLQEG